MKIDEIYEMWSQDCKLSDDLSKESLEIPYLHSKYLNIYSKVKKLLNQQKEEYKRLTLIKQEYYSNSLDIEELREYGLQPLHKKILKSEIPMYLDGDKDLSTLRLKIGTLTDSISALESILKSISNRTFMIKNAIDYMKFKNGEY